MNMVLLKPQCCNKEVLYYPPPDYVPSLNEKDPFYEDLYYKDKTAINTNERLIIICFQHYKIYKTDYNTYCINNGGNRIGWCICFLLTSFLVPLGIMFYDLHESVETMPMLISVILSFVLLFTCTLVFSCRMHYTTITLGPGSITIDQKAVLRKRNITYNAGELEKAELTGNIAQNHETGEYLFMYRLYLVPKSGKKLEIYHLVRGDDFRQNEFKGIQYFIDTLNVHIQNKMKC